jgi:chorismate synthase
VLSFLDDPTIGPAFIEAPAAKRLHHAWLGGLLEHVVSLVRVCLANVPFYPEVDPDLLLTGAILHDIGKVRELSWGSSFDYTLEGQLIGHISIAQGLLHEKIALLNAATPDDPFPPQLRLLIEHMILSHHGKLEFGSPKLPMTPEAMLLSALDDLEAKFQALRNEFAAAKALAAPPPNPPSGSAAWSARSSTRRRGSILKFHRPPKRSSSRYNKKDMLRFSTAGESHGESLVALISGLPAGVPVDQAFLDHELWRRQQGYGRGGRMRIEKDTAHILSGVRHGKTIGSPIAMTLANNDWKNWEEILPVESGDACQAQARDQPTARPRRPRRRAEVRLSRRRYMLERASARESAARVACGAVAKMLLRALGIEVASHVIRVGTAELAREATFAEIAALAQREEVLLACVDAESEARMKAEVDVALRTGDTIGGIFEVVVHGLPPGVGTHVNWDERLDGLLAQAVMSLQAVKAVELGRGVTAASFARLAGARCHRVQRRRRGRASPSSPASTTTRAASKAASPTART